MSPGEAERAPEAEAAPTAEELAALDRRSADELRALRLPVEREPAFVFRAAP